MTYDTAYKLAKEIGSCDEYMDYQKALEKVKSNETTMSLLKEYHRLQVELQSMMYTGNKDEEKISRFQKLGELLQMNSDASEFLIAEYKLNTIISDIYKIIADAANIDLSMLEA